MLLSRCRRRRRRRRSQAVQVMRFCGVAPLATALCAALKPRIRSIFFQAMDVFI